MKARFSEFSFGYALTEDIVSRVGTLRAAPVFPSLIAEGRAGGGYDVSISWATGVLFLQFKLSEGMTRRTAFEHVRGDMQVPFFRMFLHPRTKSGQQALLLALEKRHSEVYYAAPAFYTEGRFNSAYVNREVLNRTFFFKPSAIGPLRDDEVHHVSFRSGDSSALLYSREGRKLAHGVLSGEKLLGHLGSLAAQGTAPFDWAGIAGAMLEAIEEMSGRQEKHKLADLKSHLTAEHGLRQVAFLARAYFDAEPIAIGACE